MWHRTSIRGLFVAMVWLLTPAAGITSAAEPSADSAAELVRQALRAELVGDNQIRRERLEAAAALDPAHGPAEWLQGKLRLPGEATWRSVRDFPTVEVDRSILAEYGAMRDAVLRAPDVIWFDGEPAETGTFRLRFELSRKPESSELRVGAYRKLSITVNGHQLETGAVRDNVAVLSQLRHLRSGENNLLIQVAAGDGPEGLLAWFGAAFDDHRVQVVVSGATWQAHVSQSPADQLPAADDEWDHATVIAGDTQGWNDLSGPVISSAVDSSLARWCHKSALDAQSKFHWRRVLEADPENQGAIQELDLVRQDGQLWTREEARERDLTAKSLRAAANNWKPRLIKLKSLCERGDLDELTQYVRNCERDLSPATGAVLTLAVIDTKNVRLASLLLDLINRIPEPEATQALAEAAVLAADDSVRQAVIEVLKSRDPQGVAGTLLPWLYRPLQIRARWQDQPSQDDFSVGRFQRSSLGMSRIQFVDRRADHDVVYENLHAVMIRPEVNYTYRIRFHHIDMNRDGLNNETDLNLLKPLIASQNAQLRQRAKEQEVQALIVQSRTVIDRANLQREQLNLRVFQALEAVTGLKLGRKVTSWWDWWITCNSLAPSPTRSVKLIRRTSYGVRVCETANVIASCFVAGTPVWTRQGLVPIDSIRAGDEVLSQDTETGELAYKLVVITTIRPPTPVVTFTAGGDSVTTTLGHRFWRSGSGWTMAKQVVPGVPLHRMDGSHPVDLVTPVGNAPAYNLVVDDFHTYFVGEAGWLVHDNRLPVPGNVLLPGLLAEPGEIVEAVPGCGLHKALINAAQGQVAK